jgi:hypothetical protein
MRAAVLLGLSCLAPALCGADEIFTRSGGHLTGEIVSRDDTRIVVDIGIGRVELPLGYVERIEASEAPFTAYRRQARALAADDEDGWLALARWAREQDLRTQADEAFRRVVEIDPENNAARLALGHVKHGDRWMTQQESYVAQGLVSFEGRWVRPEERELALAERVAVAEQTRREADTQARVRETEARLREAEARARVAEAQVRVVEAQAHAAEVDAEAFPFPYPIVTGFTSSFGLAPVSPIITVFSTPALLQDGGRHGRGRHDKPGRRRFRDRERVGQAGRHAVRERSADRRHGREREGERTPRGDGRTCGDPMIGVARPGCR